MMRLCDMLRIPRGVTAVVGAGGKTSTLDRLAAELSETARVIRCTTTHIWPPPENPPSPETPYPTQCARLLEPSRDEIIRALKTTPLVAVGRACENGKWTACERVTIREMAELAEYVLVEADGARGLAVKAPSETEPVLPSSCGMAIAVAGMSAIGRSIRDAAHRPERYAALLGVEQGDMITPEAIAEVLNSPHGQRKGVECRFAVVLNQADGPRELDAARTCARMLDCDVCITALKTRPDFMECWRNGRCL